MAIEFERLESGNVLLKENGLIVKVFPHDTHLMVHANNANAIILSNRPDERNETSQYEVPVSAVTVPANTDRDDLLRKLATFYFIIGTAMNPFNIAIRDAATGSRALVDLNGALKVGEAVILRGDKFEGNVLNPLQWKIDTVGSGVVEGQAEGIFGTQRFRTGTTANSAVRVMSMLPMRFMISQFNISHFGMQFPASIFTDPDVIFRFGQFDPIELGTTWGANGYPVIGNNAIRNGSFWEYSNETWYIVGIKQGVETYREPLSNWSGAQAGSFNATPDLSVFETAYNAGTAFFFQASNYVDRLTSSQPYSGKYDLHIGFEIININGNTNDNWIDTRAGGGYRLGLEHGETTAYALEDASGQVKTGSGFITEASLARIGSAGGNGQVKFYDGFDNTGRPLGTIDLGGDDTKPVPIRATFFRGLYYERTGTGNNTVNLSVE